MYWLQNFFKDPWNIFDFVTVIGSIVDALVVELGVSKTKVIPTSWCMACSSALIYSLLCHFNNLKGNVQIYISKKWKFQIVIIFSGGVEVSTFYSISFKFFPFLTSQYGNLEEYYYDVSFVKGNFSSL